MAEQKKRRKAEVTNHLAPTELLLNNVDGVQTLLAHIDVLLKQADIQLGKLQPPDGRIRIEWWSCTQSWAKGGKCPELVRWWLSSKGSWQADRLPVANLTSRAKRNGWFRESYEQVRAVLENVARLMTLRNKLTSAVSRHIMQMEAIRNGNMAMLLETEGKLAEMDDWVTRKAGALSFAKAFPLEKQPKADDPT